MDQAAEDLAASYPRCRQVGDRGRDAIVVWWPQVPGPVRAMLVVARGVLIQDRPKVPRPSDQHPVGDLGPDGAYPAFGISVIQRCQLRLIPSLRSESCG